MRRRLFGGVAILFAVGQVAVAADMPVKAPYHEAPPPWTSCYVGGSAGGDWMNNGSVPITLIDGGSGATAAVVAGEIPTRFNLDGSSWIAGGQLVATTKSLRTG